MKYAALIGVGLFMLTSLVVGSRLASLYLQRRKLPELLMAIGLLFTGFLAFAVGTAAKILVVGTPSLQLDMATLGLSIEYLGDAALVLFAWRVFHAEKRWAIGAVVALALLFVAAFCGEVLSHQVLRYADSKLMSGPWIPLGLATRGLAPSWIAFECFRFHAQLRRRVRIGLADPLVMHRVGLWGVAMTACALAYAVPIAHRLIYGTGIREHLWAISAVSALAMITAVSLWFAFLPPLKYREQMASLMPRD